MECWCDKDGLPPGACPLHGVVDWQYIAASRGVEIRELKEKIEELEAEIQRLSQYEPSEVTVRRMRDEEWRGR